jgi:pentose-5-phosphate-3-epimerase
MLCLLLLSVDFLDLQHELKRLEEAGVDGVHFDVMDGQLYTFLDFQSSNVRL